MFKIIVIWYIMWKRYCFDKKNLGNRLLFLCNIPLSQSNMPLIFKEILNIFFQNKNQTCKSIGMVVGSCLSIKAMSLHYLEVYLSFSKWVLCLWYLEVGIGLIRWVSQIIIELSYFAMSLHYVFFSFSTQMYAII